MASLIPDSDKESIGNVFDDIHDTFARDVSIFKEAKKLIIIQSKYKPELYEAFYRLQ